jgi:hypothetical protein
MGKIRQNNWNCEIFQFCFWRIYFICLHNFLDFFSTKQSIICRIVITLFCKTMFMIKSCLMCNLILCLKFFSNHILCLKKKKTDIIKIADSATLHVPVLLFLDKNFEKIWKLYILEQVVSKRMSLTCYTIHFWLNSDRWAIHWYTRAWMGNVLSMRKIQSGPFEICSYH